MEIIEWFNKNEGFSAAFLSVVGLLLSTIAIVVSIQTARLPYRKRIELAMTYNYIIPDGGMAEIEVRASNLGNRAVRIKRMGLAIKKNGSMGFLYNIKNSNVPVLLKPTEEMSYVYDIETFKNFILKNNRFTMLYMYAEDNEGKEYKKKIERIYKMKKKF